MRRALTMMFLLSLLAAAPASAATVPPGISALGEYLETVPAAGGSQRLPPVSPGGVGQVGAGAGQTGRAGQLGASVLPAAVLHRLIAAGPDGRRTAALALATAPASPRTRHAAGGLSGPASSLASSLKRPLLGEDGGSGIGIGLPLALAGSLLAALAFGLRRKHSS